MPLTMRRCGAFGSPVQVFSGGRWGSSRRHCASVKSPRPTQPIWELRPETSAVCRHALALASSHLGRRAVLGVGRLAILLAENMAGAQQGAGCELGHSNIGAVLLH